MRIIALAFAASILLATTAHAQIVCTGSVSDRSFDLGVGFALNGINDVNARPLCDELAFPCTGGSSFPDPGVVVSFAGNIGDFFALILEGGVYKERWEAPEGHRPGEGPQTNTILSLGIGPRVYVPGWSERTRFFGQFLWGARMSNAVEGSNAWQPGGGLDIRVPAGVKVRLEIGYAIMHFSRRKISFPRATRSAGGGFGFFGGSSESRYAPIAYSTSSEWRRPVRERGVVPDRRRARFCLRDDVQRQQQRGTDNQPPRI